MGSLQEANCASRCSQIVLCVLTYWPMLHHLQKISEESGPPKRPTPPFHRTLRLPTEAPQLSKSSNPVNLNFTCRASPDELREIIAALLDGLGRSKFSPALYGAFEALEVVD